MKLILSFQEISEYVARHYGRSVELSKVDEKTVEIKVTQKVLVTTIKVGIALTFEKVKDAILELKYSGNIGVEALVKGALHYIKEKYPSLLPMITTHSGQHLTVDLNQIKKAKALTEKVSLTGVFIHDEDIEITGELK